MTASSALVDLICTDTGLNDDAGSVDRTKALSALNEALRSIALLTNGFPDIARFLCTTRDANIVAGNEDVAATVDGSIATNFTGTVFAIDWVGFSDSAGETEIKHELKRLSDSELLSKRPSTGQSDPMYYAVRWPVLMLDSVPTAGSRLVVGYRRSPNACVDSANDYPGELHSLFHEDLLARLACVLIFERYEGAEERAAYHRNLYREAEARYRDWNIRNGGFEAPSSDSAITRYSTPNPLSTR